MIDTLIIGGGAAGLYASSLLSEAAILERNEECGRKLLLTGGGRCNYTHNSSVQELLSHYHGNLPFIRKVLYSHSPAEIIERFKKLGISPSDENGKIFPLKGDAEDILGALLKNDTNVIHGKALEITKEDGIFSVTTDSGVIKARNIIIATGGNAYPHTGSDGSGYHLAKSLGHSITSPHPALAAIALEPSLKDAEGISLSLELRKGKKSVSDMAVVTKRGISGPAAENFSYLLNGREEITICFASPDIKTLRERKGAMLVKNALPVPPRLGEALLGEIADKKLGNLSKKEELLITERSSRHSFRASAIAESAMSTAGGVKTAEINADTMESKLVSGLYFAGDIIDVDADCGGYSLTWAFATAFIAARAIRS